jgi:hypothetical protein
MKNIPGVASGLFTAILFVQCVPQLNAEVLFFSGNLRTDATVLSCGSSCTLDFANYDGDYAQWAAVVKTFVVPIATTIQAISYSFGGGASQTGAVVAAGGLEPYLSLFNSSGDFLASTYFGTSCPAGAQTWAGNCFDVALDGGILAPGTYEIALSAWANMSLAENNGPPANLADGFSGLGNLAAGEDLHYAFDVVLPSVVEAGGVTAPEPGTLILLPMGFAVLLLSGRNKQLTNWFRRKQR